MEPDLSQVKALLAWPQHSGGMKPLQPASILVQVLAIFWLGIMAGFFATYSANVSLATQGLDGSLYAVVQSALNRNVRHALFFVFFFAPPALCLLALVLGWRGRQRWGWFMLAAGLLYLLGIVFFTREVNLPLNAYTESWNPAALPADWSQTRDRWKLANDWRTAASAFAFLGGLVSLALRALCPAR